MGGNCQHTPARIPKRSEVIQILPGGMCNHHGVEGTGSAQHFSPGPSKGAIVGVLLRFGDVRIVVFGIPGVEEHLRTVDEDLILPVLASFNDADSHVFIFTQASGEGKASSAWENSV